MALTLGRNGIHAALSGGFRGRFLSVYGANKDLQKRARGVVRLRFSFYPQKDEEGNATKISKEQQQNMYVNPINITYCIKYNNFHIGCQSKR